MKIENLEYLLQIPKNIVIKNEQKTEITIKQTYPFSKRYELVSEKEEEFTFLWQIRQSEKNNFKVSLHILENNRKIDGLMRIDYNSKGTHKNPEKLNKFVPKKFHKFKGEYITESHVHYHVEGYKSLAWAIPIKEDHFKIKELKEENFQETFRDVIKCFAETVNIKTKIKIQSLLL